jgi:hypothetical protein
VTYSLTQWAIEFTDPDTDDVTLFGVFHSEEHAEQNIAKAQEWGVDAKMEVVPLERFGLAALRECGWLPDGS